MLKPFLSTSRCRESLATVFRGVEKEGLRVASNGKISMQSHPKGLGSTLTHSSITTDYSEALLEFITPVQDQIDDTLSFLANLHRFTYQHIDDELIWPASMPCTLAGDESIPIAEYGSSNIGQLKHVYRQGLGVRYGRIMQSIAGIHYNFSLSDQFWDAYHAETGANLDIQAFKSREYFALLRNFQRHAWLLYYLFGASPVLDESFLDGASHQLQRFGDRTLGSPYATSLRMSDLGYQNSAQASLYVCNNSLDNYIQTLSNAVKQHYAPYKEIGLKRGDQFIQLNDYLLQIENEYYSEVRPKRVTKSGERPVDALRDRGVEYIEVRAIDLNPYLPLGLDAEQMAFIDIFLTFCLLSDSRECNEYEWQRLKDNKQKVILRGRDPELELNIDGSSVRLIDAASNLVSEMQEVAEALASACEDSTYLDSMKTMRARIEDPNQTPSGQLMKDVKGGREFISIIDELAKTHRDDLLTHPLPDLFSEKLALQANESLLEQQRLEQSDSVSFEEFLEAYNQF